MTKVPTGDQPGDIEHKILDLCYQYVYPKSSIIMAVCPANNDLANADALKLSRKVDPMGDRTIGVLTKVDLMDEGTNINAILQGKIYPLKLGYVPVVCRSQKDIQNGIKMDDHLKAEEHFYKKHPSYQGISAKTGTPYLCKTLNEIIVRHIKQCLPSIRSKITSMLYQKEKELKAHQLAKGVDNQQQLVLNIIAKYSKCFEEYLEGRFVREASELLKGGSRLNYIFYDLFTNTIAQVDPFDALSDSDIQTAIRNCGALKPNLFVPEVAFEILAKQQIKRLEQPSLQCVQLVFEELRKISLEINVSELHRYQKLRQIINQEMLDLLVEFLQPTNKMVKNLIVMQDSYINTYHPDFMGGADSIFTLFDPAEQQRKKEERAKDRMKLEQFNLNGDQGKKKKNTTMHNVINTDLNDDEGQANASKPGDQHVTQTNDLPHQRLTNYENMENAKFMQSDDRQIRIPKLAPQMRARHDDPGQSSQRGNMETNIIKNLIESYMDTVRKSVSDFVPKTIMHCLVNKSKTQCQRILVQKIYKDGSQLDEILIEDNETKLKRAKCAELVKTLKSSLEFLNEVRDFYFEESHENL